MAKKITIRISSFENLEYFKAYQKKRGQTFSRGINFVFNSFCADLKEKEKK
jgi:hypothetical protein